MKSVFYRIVTENFADEPGQRWPVEVLIQTEDPADFDSFEEAIDELLDRIQERIDREEDQPEPDPGYLAKLEEKMGDSNSDDWDEYCCNISQPTVFRKVRGRHEAINLAEVAGRRRMLRMIDRGVSFEPYQLRLLRRLEGQARVGKRAVKVKRKRLKTRARPALTYDCVRIDPRLAERFDADFIRGLLDHHRRAYERHDWSPHRGGFTSTIGQHGRPDRAFACFTVFLDRENSVTFAALVDPGEGLPDDHDLMRMASVKFRWQDDAEAASSTAWRPEFN